MCNQPREAMAVYRRMLEEGYSPNSVRPVRQGRGLVVS